MPTKAKKDTKKAPKTAKSKKVEKELDDVLDKDEDVEDEFETVKAKLLKEAKENDNQIEQDVIYDETSKFELDDAAVEELMKFFSEKGLLLSNGAMYGQGGEGFVRMNIGCPRKIVSEALWSKLI